MCLESSRDAKMILITMTLFCNILESSSTSIMFYIILHNSLSLCLVAHHFFMITKYNMVDVALSLAVFILIGTCSFSIYALILVEIFYFIFEVHLIFLS